MAWKCGACHYGLNSDDDSHCVMCNATRPLAASANNVLTDTNSLPPGSLSGSSTNSISQPDTPSTHSGNSGIFSGGPGDIHTEQPRPQPSSTNHGSRGILRGRISHVEQRDEKPPFNIYRTLSWILIWILISVPFGVLFVCAAIISLSFAIIGFQTLSQFFNPLTWTLAITEIVEVIVLRRFRSDDRIPIFRGMIEDRNSREHSFMILGPLHRGNIFVGQNIELTGQWHRGSFIARNGVDLTTSAEITSAYRDPWRGIFCAVLCLEALLGLLLLVNWQNIMDMVR